MSTQLQTFDVFDTAQIHLMSSMISLLLLFLQLQHYPKYLYISHQSQCGSLLFSRLHQHHLRVTVICDAALSIVVVLLV